MATTNNVNLGVWTPAAPPQTAEFASGLASVMQRALREVSPDLLRSRPAALPDVAARAPAAGLGPSTEALFRQMDLNGDGVISRDEFNKSLAGQSAPSLTRPGRWNGLLNSDAIGGSKSPHVPVPADLGTSASSTLPAGAAVGTFGAPGTSASSTLAVGAGVGPVGASGTAGMANAQPSIAQSGFGAGIAHPSDVCGTGCFNMEPVAAVGTALTPNGCGAASGASHIRRYASATMSSDASGAVSSSVTFGRASPFVGSTGPVGSEPQPRPPPQLHRSFDRPLDVSPAPLWHSSPQRPRGVGSSLAPASNIHTAKDAEVRSLEIASLRRDITSLLRTNHELHTELARANAGETSLLGYDPPASSQAWRSTDAPLFGEPVAAQGGPDPHAEQRVLEERVRRLTEECQALEKERDFHARRREAAESGADAESQAAMTSMLLRERDDLRQRAHAASLGRQAAEQRLGTAEEILAKTLEEMDGRQQQRSFANSEHGGLSGWLAQEVAALRRDLAEAETRLSEIGHRLAQKNQEIERNEREYAEVKVEYDALVVANDTLRTNIANTQDRIEVERRGLNGAEAELTELSAQLSLKKFDFSVEVDDAKSRGEVLESAVQESRAAFEVQTESIVALKSEAAELQSQLETLNQECAEQEAKAQRSREEQNAEAADVESVTSKLSAEKAQLSKQLEEVVGSKRQHQLRDEKLAREYEQTSHDLALERSRASEAFSRAQLDVSEAEHRVEALLKQIGDQRQQNAELRRELSVAKGVAGEVGRTPWAATEDRANGRSASPSRSWATSALQMHREIDLLKGWKAESMGVLQRLQADMGTAQENYQRQVHENQKLQAQLELMGRQARVAVTGVGAPQMPGMGSSGTTVTGVGAPQMLCVESSGTTVTGAGAPQILGVGSSGTAPAAPGLGMCSSGTEPSAAGPRMGNAGIEPVASGCAAFIPSALLGHGHALEGGLGAAMFSEPAMGLGVNLTSPAVGAEMCGLPVGPDIPERADLPAPPRSGSRHRESWLRIPDMPLHGRAAAVGMGQTGGLTGSHIPSPAHASVYDAYKAPHSLP